ncbi:MAG TPA: metallohydrolase [Pinirhizobacter sp.]|uniref:ComEC/Rec2 family competence protein n=1 Tax=Pinirhizobacter sp. TaxID=2950432 RepID=UPI002D0782A9|nr:metallohydrolase [Pinirhizobacter sp.]HMH69143.1 metallohydrolase [Pinirhizobacter sp.]
MSLPQMPSSRNYRLAAARTLALAGLLALAAFGAGTAWADGVQQALPPWTDGYLYIHHISTGRGNAAYIVMPDGTTMLIDAGESDPEFVKSVAPLKAFPPLPDGTHSSGYWIANYIRQFAPAGRPVALDYALITHFHTDHIGTIRPTSPMSATGAYRLAGITEVGDLVPIKTLVDRAAPNYTVPVDIRACAKSNGDDGRSLANYLDMVAFRKGHGEPVVGLQPGQLDQIRLQQAQKFPDFHIRNIASSGVIWTGRGTDTQQYIPPDAIKDCHFDENPLSNVIRISYGKFSYYSGGDIPGVPDYTQPFWRDIETPVAAVVGPVDAMTLDHHGNRDSTNGAILRALRPRVIIQQNWLSAQPGEEVVVRMASQEFYPGPRDVFATGMSPETRIAIGPIMDKIYRSYGGHVVLRVAPGGSTYEVFILNDADQTREVIKRFGPYQAH